MTPRILGVDPNSDNARLDGNLPEMQRCGYPLRHTNGQLLNGSISVSTRNSPSGRGAHVNILLVQYLCISHDGLIAPA